MKRTNHLPFTIHHSLLLQVGERRPARVNLALLAGATARVQISAARRAQTFALLPAESARREREKYLLAYQLVQVNRVAVVGRESHVLGQQFDVLGPARGLLTRDEGRVELDFKGDAHDGETAVAGDFHLGSYVAAQSNLLAPAPRTPLDGGIRSATRVLFVEL